MLHKNFFGALTLVVCAGFVMTSGIARAESVASDTASDPAYDAPGGWEETDNGGTGFEAWDFSGGSWVSGGSPYDAPHFIDSSSSFNDLGGTAWGLTNSSSVGATTNALRPFATPLAVDDTLTVDVDNPEFDTYQGGAGGFRIQFLNENNESRLTLFNGYAYLSNQWLVYDNTSEIQTGLDDTEGSSGFNVSFTLTGVDTYDLTITPFLGSISPMNYTGTLFDRGVFSDIVAIRFQMYGNDSSSTGSNEFFFANLEINNPISGETIPTPASFTAMAVMLGALAARRRR